MHFVPVAPPQTVLSSGAFDYVAVDARRRRVYAAHTGHRALTIVNADTGVPIGEVAVGGPMHGVAVNPATGRVYTGNGSANSVSEIDPDTRRVVASAAVGGPVDAVAYDAKLARIYADEDGGTRIFVIDAKTMKQIATITVPGRDPEYLVVDPQTHDVYTNIAADGAYIVVDPQTLRARQTVRTPETTSNHPLQFDAASHAIITGGNGKLSFYNRSGKKRYELAVPKGIDQCDLDSLRQRLACAGGNKLTLVAVPAGSAPSIIAQLDEPASVHTVAIDRRTGYVWIVGVARSGSFVRRYALAP